MDEKDFSLLGFEIFIFIICSFILRGVSLKRERMKHVQCS